MFIYQSTLCWVACTERCSRGHSHVSPRFLVLLNKFVKSRNCLFQRILSQLLLLLTVLASITFGAHTGVRKDCAAESMAEKMGDTHQRGLQLLLTAEQVVCFNPLSPKSKLQLSELKTEDGRFSFQPSLEYNDLCQLKLSITEHSSKSGLILIHCTMIGRCIMRNETQTPDSTPWQVSANILVLPDGHNMNVLLKYLCSSERRGHYLTLTFTVHEILAARPVPAACLQLNRARLQGAHCDVKLVVEDVELDAHRAVLAARSPVLDKMLSGDFKEAREARVEVVGFSPTAVEKFIEFLYTDHIEDWGKCHLELLRLADMYLVADLKAECSLLLWNFGGARALEVLHATCLGSAGDVISGKLRQRLVSIVAADMQALVDKKEWADFKATYPVLVDMFLGSVAHNCTVWSP
ncbi:Kelch-like protein 3 [Frankliniella fusca]|uniref:Kelch-like protein 3 n=1 Tax=Frankliniella fusca TaxID=407009 RepID=A0AAE1GRL9_9NEOP|nr:Kelch-like protein 3 [Frankliniella fusca]